MLVERAREGKEGRVRGWGAARTAKVLPGTNAVRKSIRGLGPPRRGLLVERNRLFITENDYSSQKTESWVFCILLAWHTFTLGANGTPYIFFFDNCFHTRPLRYPVTIIITSHESLQGILCTLRCTLPCICVYEMPEVLEAWYSFLVFFMF